MYSINIASLGAPETSGVLRWGQSKLASVFAAELRRTLIAYTKRNRSGVAFSGNQQRSRVEQPSQARFSHLRPAVRSVFVDRPKPAAFRAAKIGVGWRKLRAFLPFHLGPLPSVLMPFAKWRMSRHAPQRRRYAASCRLLQVHVSHLGWRPDRYERR